MTNNPAIQRIPPEYRGERRFDPGAPPGLPYYVLDYIGDEAKIRELHPGARERGRVMFQLMQLGEATVVDRIFVTAQPREGVFTTSIPCLGLTEVLVPPEILERYPTLLDGVAFAVAKLHHDDGHLLDGHKFPFTLADLDPIRTEIPDQAALLDAIRVLGAADWRQVICNAIGLRTEAFTERQLDLQLCRLLPLVEPNLNLAEFGPPGTGKSFTAANASPRVILRTGGSLTLAELTVNLNTRRLGLFAHFDAVILDEANAMTISGGEPTVGLLKEYLQTGSFTRGGVTYQSQAGVVLAGNIPVNGHLPAPTLPHLFATLPPELQNAALFDRIHGYHPGWEMPPVRPGALYVGPVLAADVLAELLHGLRRQRWAGRLQEKIAWLPGMTTRDLQAVSRLASGMLKLSHPGANWTDDDLRKAAALASELRQRVYNQMVRIEPGGFAPRSIGFEGMAPHSAADLADLFGRAKPASAAVEVGRVVGLGGRPGDLSSGETFVIQAVLVPGRGLDITGLHGPVLRDSVRTAWAFIASHASELGVHPGRLGSKQVHIHLQRIWQKREGPSAGAAIATAILSVLTDRPVQQRVAITGEVSLSGEVLAVGAVPAKVIAAHRDGHDIILVPRESESQLTEIPEEVRSQVTIHLVETISEVLSFAFAACSGSERPALIHRVA